MDDKAGLLPRVVITRKERSRETRGWAKGIGITDIIYAVGFVACLGLAVFVFMNVSLNTQVPYRGIFDRGGESIPMPVAILLPLVAIFLFWLSERLPDVYRKHKVSRAVTYVIGTATVLLCVFFQWLIAQAALITGGYFAA